MTKEDMLETLARTASVTREEAARALEESGWNYSAALSALTGQETVSYGGAAAAVQEAPREDTAEETQETAAEEPRETPQPEPETARRAGSGDDKAASDGGSVGETLGVALFWIKRVFSILCTNNFVINRKGKRLMRFPAVILLALFLFRPWWMLLILVIGMVPGLRYTFDGAVLGNEKVTGFMKKINDFADKIEGEITRKNGGQ